MTAQPTPCSSRCSLHSNRANHLPKRIQRKRTKGWRMPEGAIYVGRPTRWGNIVKVGECEMCGLDIDHPGEAHFPYTPQSAVELFRAVAESNPCIGIDVAPLAGHDLACWCPLDQPCHADVLLDLANQ